MDKLSEKGKLMALDTNGINKIKVICALFLNSSKL